jgi:hypothetical protein
VFLGTHWQVESQTPERAEVRMHIILLAAMHPELKTSEEVQQFIADVQRKIPEKSWKQIANSNRKPEDGWATRIRRGSASPSKRKAPFWTITDSCRRIRGSLRT